MKKKMILTICVILIIAFCTPLQASLVGWWKFDEGAGSTAYDSSGNNSTGTISGTYSWIDGYVGPKALNLSYAYVTIADKAVLRPSRFTVCAWVRLPGPAGDYARLLEKGNDNHETYNLQMSGYRLTFMIRDTAGSTHSITYSKDIPQNEWTLVTCVYDGSKMSIYFDGQFDKSLNGSFTPYNSSGEPLVIGARPPNMDRRFSGEVDDVRVYNHALTAGDIEDLYIWKGGDTNLAALPSPLHLSQNLSPIVQMSWLPGKNAVSHDVYLGTDLTSVSNATRDSDEFLTNVEPNSYDPNILDFGKTYYWRIDEVNDTQTWNGVVWSFGTNDGKAYNPVPRNDDYLVPIDANLTWEPGLLAAMHDVYFGFDYNSVANADTSSLEYQTTQPETIFFPSIMELDTAYYWRIDERSDITYAKGDVWKFTTAGEAGNLHLKVDLGLPFCDGTGTVPGTVKPGWWGFVAPRWADMYMHDAIWERGENISLIPPATDGIDGSGVHVALDISNGDGGFHVYGMCRDNLSGGGCPTGSPVGDPIANGWFHNVDWGGLCTGDINMRITDLPPGRYQLKSYHNHWEPQSQSTRNCLTKTSTMPNMPGGMASPPNPAVFAQALPVGATGCYGGVLGYGTGTGVTSITEAYNIDVTSTTLDSQVATSLIVFETDGSDVLVTYVGGNNDYPDPARPDREGSKAILNAFEIIQVESFLPEPCGLYQDSIVDEFDIEVFAQEWLWSGTPGVSPADFDGSGYVDFLDYCLLAQQWYENCE